MTDLRLQDGEVELSDAERAARREWQNRSRACGHAWAFDRHVTERRCCLCGRVQVWSTWLTSWTSRAQAERSAKINKETRRLRESPQK
jgi:hypothetical protein